MRSPRFIPETSRPLNFEYRVNFITNYYPRSSAASYSLAILTRLGEVVVDHSAAIFLSLRYRGVAPFLVSTDLVLRVKAFEHEFAGGDHLAHVRLFEVERDQRRLDQIRHSFQQRFAFAG